MIGNDPCDRDDRIFVGGPVPGPLVALTRYKLFPTSRFCPASYLFANHDSLDLIVRQKNVPFGCERNAGWGSGQLEDEMEAGGWLSTRATVDDVFADHESIWKTVTQRIGWNYGARSRPRAHAQ